MTWASRSSAMRRGESRAFLAKDSLIHARRRRVVQGSWRVADMGPSLLRRSPAALARERRQCWAWPGASPVVGSENRGRHQEAQDAVRAGERGARGGAGGLGDGGGADQQRWIRDRESL